MRLHALVAAEETAAFWEAAGWRGRGTGGHYAIRWLRFGAVALLLGPMAGALLGGLTGFAIGLGIAMGLSIGAFTSQWLWEWSALRWMRGPLRHGKERLTLWPTPAGLRIRGEHMTVTILWDRLTVAGKDPVVLTVGRVSLAIPKDAFQGSAPGARLKRWAATRLAKTTIRVPIEDVNRFWQAVPGPGMGRLPSAMLRYGAIGAVLGGVIGWATSGVPGAVGIGFGFAVIAALAPAVPEIEVLRALFGAPGERVDLAAVDDGIRITSDWQSTTGTLRRVRGRIHILAGSGRISVPAVAFEDGVQLSRLLESA